MESKKLQTTIKDGVLLTTRGDMWDRPHGEVVERDARIAHEQRALIEKLVASLKESRTAMGYAHDESEDFRHAENRNACPCEMAAIFRRAGEALAAAAPFLLED